MLWLISGIAHGDDAERALASQRAALKEKGTALADKQDELRLLRFHLF